MTNLISNQWDLHGLCDRLAEVFNEDDTPDELSSHAREAIEELWEERDRLRAVLSELVRLKDLKTDAEAINTSGDWNAYHHKRDMLVEYVAKKSVAWDAARQALSGDSSAPETSTSQNMHSDEWWQAELDRCVAVEQEKYRALFAAYTELQAGDPEVTAGVKPSAQETPEHSV